MAGWGCYQGPYWLCLQSARLLSRTLFSQTASTTTSPATAQCGVSRVPRWTQNQSWKDPKNCQSSIKVWWISCNLSIWSLYNVKFFSAQEPFNQSGEPPGGLDHNWDSESHWASFPTLIVSIIVCCFFQEDLDFMFLNILDEDTYISYISWYEATVRGEFPWMVALLQSGAFLCGATLIRFSAISSNFNFKIDF